MARGKSGRIVIEVDPELKRDLYSSLESQQQTMKDWFVKEAELLIYDSKQISNTKLTEAKPPKKEEEKELSPVKEI